ncbi:MAG: hypothetical protein M0C28_16900 [Candidatus Moduliflexus flocculans]|nr:hypothetical protein [Candidatus Moduliflexus flocculans]
MEDVTDGIALSEFTPDDFRIELINYIEANRERLRERASWVVCSRPAAEG